MPDAEFTAWLRGASRFGLQYLREDLAEQLRLIDEELQDREENRRIAARFENSRIDFVKEFKEFKEKS